VLWIQKYFFCSGSDFTFNFGPDTGYLINMHFLILTLPPFCLEVPIR
jgi:hypothetical protein